MKRGRIKNLFLDELRKVPNIKLACDKLNISRQTFYRWQKEDIEFDKLSDQALSEGDENTNDSVEARLLELAIREKKFPAIKFHLQNRHPNYKKKDVEDYDKNEYIKKTWDQLCSVFKNKEIPLLSERSMQKLRRGEGLNETDIPDQPLT